MYQKFQTVFISGQVVEFILNFQITFRKFFMLKYFKSNHV